MDTRSGGFLDDLNPVQRQAVRHGEGPLLILAGAGSGKTRVLTYRIAHLILEQGVSPRRLLAVTFTNKAASEMKRRVASLVGPESGSLWIGTFHSICARILRREARWGWWSPDYSIYDMTDQTDLIKTCMERAGVAASVFAPKVILSAISGAKDKLLKAEEYAALGGDYFEQCVARVYREYEKGLAANNAFDFDDLIMKTVELLRTQAPVLDGYAGRFEHVLVDEYQDTSHAQYVLVNLLSSRHGNICVVGDDDQSIYGWRGADITNILEFEEDHPDATVLRLEQNYRSTRSILDAAHDVVSRNVKRKEKKLWTERPEGAPVLLTRVGSEYQEADALRDLILSRLAGGELDYHDFAVLYRTHAQSRVIEDSLRRAGIAYDIVGGVRFYERSEVKDVLAYLKVLVNPADAVSLKRIINVPPRRIGDKTVERLEAFAASAGIPLYEALCRAAEVDGLLAAARDAVSALGAMFARIRLKVETGSIEEILPDVLDSSGYVTWLDGRKSEDSAQKLANVEELVSAASEFVEASGEESLSAFLEQVSLVADIDRWEDGANAVSLMTLHNAKGLEFTVVMIPGLEEGLLPHESSFRDDEEMEEERRLFYVGVTRAMDELYLFASDTRRRAGGLEVRSPSRFVDEIASSHITVESAAAHSSGRRYGGATGRGRGESAYRDPAPRKKVPRSVFPDYENESQEPGSFRPGTQVTHPSWGVGTILDASGAGDDTIVTVRFSDGGEKRIMLRYGKLKRVD